MRLLKLLFVLPLVALLITAAFGVWWVDQPLRFPASVSEQQPLDVEIAPGQSASATLEILDPGKRAVAFTFDFH